MPTPAAARVLVARQPIFNARLEVTAYELLFRSLPWADLSGHRGTQATARLLVENLMEQGSRTLTQGHPAHVNFTRELIVGGYAEMIPHATVVIEVLEDVPADAEVVAALAGLRESLYRVALDDVRDVERVVPFKDVISSVKIDLPFVDVDRLPQMVSDLRKLVPGVKLTAEKVETWEMFQLTKQLGFDGFQGYFLSKPITLEQRSVEAFRPHYLQLLNLTSAPEVDMAAVEQIVRTDVALTSKLLRHANSATSMQIRSFDSIREALVLLGAEGVRRTAALAALAGLGRDRPEELVQNSVVRARFCESLSTIGNLGAARFDLFLLGMFSMVDALLGAPMDQALDDLPVTDAVRGALQFGEGRLGAVLRLVEAYEHAAWDDFQEIAADLNLDVALIPALYVGAVQWMSDAFETARAA
ncbi:MAG: HDOD domain-containing protein [Chloroflexi bacterium]|nr:HDOD domain-containing protein [Chloroflexota bacterium]MDA1003227.1 HDOD domain-containing protein [Chloroflexota bacterium]